jgi:hypothetical protein
LGFDPDPDPRSGAPICRMRTTDDLVLDVIPLDAARLGFTNRWYPYTVDTAHVLTLDLGLEIRAAMAPAFIATKWEAFRSRGVRNMLMSHDVEDILAVIAGRPSIVAEVRESASDVRAFIIEQTVSLLSDPSVDEIVEDALPDARHVRGLVAEVRERLRTLAAP